MEKIWLILQREYSTRVRNKTFILSTILLPLFFVGLIVASAYFSLKGEESLKVAVVDHSGLFESHQPDDGQITYDFTHSVTESNFKEKGYDALLIIPKDLEARQDSIALISNKQLSMNNESRIRGIVDDAIRDQVFLQHNIDRKVLDSIQNLNAESLYHFSPVIRQGEKKEQSRAGLAYAIGFGSGFLIYMTLFIYGAAVMRGVMEEKMNRIAEVIISSVRPFQLMAGKILGIAAVGLTQLLIWIVLILAFAIVFPAFLPGDGLNQIPGAASAVPPAGDTPEFQAAMDMFLSANWGLIIPCFIFFFLGGYLFYASLFAAVGSVVNEDPQEAQALMLPISMPIILSFVIMATVVANPDSSLAVWASIIPFSSPIVMMARLPAGGVPAWQLVLSMVSLAGGFILTTLLAAKIYRTGILLYGKKVTFKEMGKWLFTRA